MTNVTLTATFTTAGPFTWTAPPGVSSVTVACWGGGGAGGDAGGTSGSNGGGGGGGECALEPALAVTPTLTYSGTVGAGGPGSGAGIQPGGATSFTGDSVTVTANGGGGGALSTAASGAAGLGGDGSVNTVSAAGGAGDVGTAATNGGGGGGAAGANLVQGFPGVAGAGSTAGGSPGGLFPGGAGGAGSTSGAGPGGNGVAPGGGGGGALSTGTGRQGGSGANGQVTITWTQADPVTLIANTTSGGGAWTYTAPFGATAVNAQAWGAGGGGFNTTGSAPGGTRGLVGGSIPTQCFKAGCYNQGRTQDAGDNTFIANVGRSLPNGHLAVTKKFWNPSDFHTSNNFNNLQNYANYGTKVVFAVKPGFTAGSTSGPNGGNGNATDLAALKTLLNTIATMGFTSVTGQIVFWQEPADSQNHLSATDYGLMIKSYGPAVNASVAADGLPFPVCVNVNYVGGASVSNATDYASAALGLRSFASPGVTIGGISMDYYSNSYWNSNKNVIKLLLDSTDSNGDSISGIADAHSLPFGLNEWGHPPANYGGSPSSWDPNGVGTAYLNYIINFMSARLAAGKTNLDMIYYDGQCSPTGSGVDITSPLGQDPTTGTLISSTPVNTYNDPRIAFYQQMFDALTSASTAVGGAGGGGGEYAAEASLAIVDSQTYAISVGQGNILQSGGNTTIAGQAVTVTAHGGHVATATTAGGTAGSGSANTTHFSGGAGGAGGGTTGGGGGGGGSGGTGAGGNAGGAGTPVGGGAGGAAVTGGGKGGFGGGPNANGGVGSAPGGGGGGGGAAGNVGDAADGQITLSSFVTHPAGPVSYGLAPLALAGTGNVNVSSYALAPLAFSASGSASQFTFVQMGPTATGTFTLPAPSTAGNLLIARVVQSTQSQSTPPANQGWSLVHSAAAQGANGWAEMWMLNPCPGGITSIAWTGGTALRGYVAEYAPPAGYAANLVAHNAANFAAPSTSFPVSTSVGSSAAGGLALTLFEDQFSVNPAGSTFTTPTGWTRETFVQASVPDCYVGYYQLGVPQGALSVTGVFSTSTNQTGAAAIIAVFNTVPAVGGTSGQVALAPLSWGGTANSVVPPGQVQCNGVYQLAPLAIQSPSEAVTFPASVLPVRVEILVNDVWADITGYVYQRDAITISGRGRADEASTAQPAQVTFTLNNRDGSFSPANTTGQFYPYLTRNTQVRISVVNAVTPQGAWYSGVRFWGEVPAWPVVWTPSAADVYITVTAAGVLQRLRQSKKALSPLNRYYSNLINILISSGGVTGGVGTIGFSNSLVPAGYWPCEDGSTSATFASGLPGGSPMTWSGTPGLGGDSTVLGSAPFATLSGSAWTGTPGAFNTGGQTFTTPGTFTWTCPAGITTILAECWGAGGGGANGTNSAGGGGGEYAAEPNLAVTPGKTYTFVVGAGGSGGAGAFSATGGTGGANSQFTGDTVTVRAHGGDGAPKGSSGHASGGTGSTNTTHHNGGNGAASSGHFGGNGGGGSGGSAAAGNTGSQSTGTGGGAGGSAVTAGGPGGTGGLGATSAQGAAATAGLMPVPGPGGGGGGGGLNNYNSYGKPGGGGQGGQVRISFGAQAPAPAANVLRAVIDVPSGGGVDGATYLQALSGGTIATLNLVYHTANNGSFALIGKNIGGSQVFTSGTKTFGCNGQPMIVSAELTQANATQFNWKLTAITPGATVAAVTFTGGPFTGTLGSVTEVLTNPTAPAETSAVGIGHVAVQYVVDPILNLAGAFNGYNGELAATRFTRLCGEQRIPVTLAGAATDTPQMGPQPVAQLADLLQDCETADLGQMSETRGAFGLTYATRASMQDQSPDVVLDYSKAQLAPPLTPTDDDSLTRNDIVVSRSNGSISGSSYELTQFTGNLSVQDPPDGVGWYTFSPSVNLFTDTQLQNYATWLLTLGTVDEFRYPTITVNLHRDTVSDGTFSALAALDITGYLQVINAPSWLPPGPINQLVFGYTETLDAKAWTITFNTVPETPYAGNNLPTW